MASADIADAYMNLGLQPDNWKNITLNIALDSNKSIDLAYCRLAFVSRKLIFSQKSVFKGGFDSSHKLKKGKKTPMVIVNNHGCLWSCAS